jgi:hypothetical protein
MTMETQSRCLPADLEQGERRCRQRSDKRQRAAIEAYAKASGYEIVAGF